jgi:osmotically-inducible protein OsmY
MKDDYQTKQDVVAELKWNAEIDETKIGVAVSDGAVTLSGHVPTYRQKMAAAKAAKRVAGVLAIVNKLEVQLESEHRATDEGLAERIANVLSWNVSVPENAIKAEIKNGIVTLTGEVAWQYQRQNILKDIEHASGVVDVINLITVKPRMHAIDVQAEIQAALKRHAEVEGSKITVTVCDGIVTLSGEVESMAEMDRIEDAAWGASGVSKVVDNLQVSG